MGSKSFGTGVNAKKNMFGDPFELEKNRLKVVIDSKNTGNSKDVSGSHGGGGGVMDGVREGVKIDSSSNGLNSNSEDNPSIPLTNQQLQYKRMFEEDKISSNNQQLSGQSATSVQTGRGLETRNPSKEELAQGRTPGGPKGHVYVTEGNDEVLIRFFPRCADGSLNQVGRGMIVSLVVDSKSV